RLGLGLDPAAPPLGLGSLSVIERYSTVSVLIPHVPADEGIRNARANHDALSTGRPGIASTHSQDRPGFGRRGPGWGEDDTRRRWTAAYPAPDPESPSQGKSSRGPHSFQEPS